MQIRTDTYIQAHKDAHAHTLTHISESFSILHYTAFLAENVSEHTHIHTHKKKRGGGTS